jgi:hypothetical protein
VDKAPYYSYLLRMQRINNNETPVWLFSLVSPASGEPLHMLGLEAFVNFLQQQMEVDRQLRQEPFEGDR